MRAISGSLSLPRSWLLSTLSFCRAVRYSSAAGIEPAARRTSPIAELVSARWRLTQRYNGGAISPSPRRQLQEHGPEPIRHGPAKSGSTSTAHPCCCAGWQLIPNSEIPLTFQAVVVKIQLYYPTFFIHGNAVPFTERAACPPAGAVLPWAAAGGVKKLHEEDAVRRSI